MDERKFKPAWRSFYRHIIIIAALFIATLGVSIYLTPANYQKWLWLLFAAAAAYAAADMVYKRSSVLLVLKPDEVAIERGLIGRQSIEISTRNIRTIKVNQSIIQRILNVGDIRVASSGTDGYEIYALNMPAPHDIREIMQANQRSTGETAKQKIDS